MCWRVLEESGLELVEVALGRADGGCNIVGSIAEQTEDYQACSREKT